MQTVVLTAPRSQHTTPQFQTFTLPVGWDELATVQISAPLRGFATDNVVVSVPEPLTIGAVTGALTLGISVRRVRRVGGNRSTKNPRTS